MLTYYKYKVDNGQIQLSQVPEPYQTQMRNQGYTDAEPAQEETASE